MIKKSTFINIEDDLIQIGIYSENQNNEINLVFNENYRLEKINFTNLSTNIIGILDNVSRKIKEPISNIYIILPDNKYNTFSNSVIISNSNKEFSFISKDLILFKNNKIQEFLTKNPNKTCINFEIEYFLVNSSSIFNRFQNFINVYEIKIRYIIYYSNKSQFDNYKKTFTSLKKYNFQFLCPLLSIKYYIKNSEDYFLKLCNNKIKSLSIVNVLDKKIKKYKILNGSCEIETITNNGYEKLIKLISEKISMDKNFVYELFNSDLKLINYMDNYDFINKNKLMISIDDILTESSRIMFKMLKNYFTANNITLLLGRCATNNLILKTFLDKHPKANVLIDIRYNLRLKYTIFFKIIGSSYAKNTIY